MKVSTPASTSLKSFDRSAVATDRPALQATHPSSSIVSRVAPAQVAAFSVLMALAAPAGAAAQIGSFGGTGTAGTGGAFTGPFSSVGAGAATRIQSGLVTNSLLSGSAGDSTGVGAAAFSGAQLGIAAGAVIGGVLAMVVAIVAITNGVKKCKEARRTRQQAALEMTASPV
jgi:hypothetical protein